MWTILEKLGQIFDPERFTAWLAVLLPDAILALLIFAVYYLFYRLLSATITHVAARVKLERTVTGFLLIAVKYVVLIFGTITALQQIGINLTAIIGGLGIAGLALGFAAKDVLANVIAGIFLFWDKPFVIGDLIEASDEYGEVSEITLRTTRIITVDGRMVSIPNSLLVNSKITSYTMHPHLRLDLDFSIGVNEDIGRARDVILAVIKGDVRLMAAPAPVVVVTKLGDYYVGLQLRVWLADERTHIPVRLELREKMKQALDQAGIIMPFETLEVIQRTKSKMN